MRTARTLLAFALGASACNSYAEVDGTPLERAPMTAPIPAPKRDAGPASEAGVAPPEAKSCALTEGRYESGVVSVEGDQGVCARWPRSGESKPFILTELPDDVWEMRTTVGNAPPVSFALNRERCELTRTSRTTFDWKDNAGADVVATMAVLERLRLDGSALSWQSEVDLTTTTTGAEGFPCEFVARASPAKVD
jgi:hypothetical protein